MACLTPIYSANRSLREYVERFYIPAATAYQLRAQNRGAVAEQMSAWRQAIEAGWQSLRFGRVAIDTRSGCHHFSVEVALGVLQPSAVCVELYADPLSGQPPFRQEMTPLQRLDGTGTDAMDLYVASVPALREAADYTARIVPRFPGVHVPLEAPRFSGNDNATPRHQRRDFPEALSTAAQALHLVQVARYAFERPSARPAARPPARPGYAGRRYTAGRDPEWRARRMHRLPARRSPSLFRLVARDIRRHVGDIVGAQGQLFRVPTVPPTMPFNSVSSSASELPA